MAQKKPAQRPAGKAGGASAATRAQAEKLKAQQRRKSRTGLVLGLTAGAVVIGGLFVALILFIVNAGKEKEADYQVLDSETLVVPTVAGEDGGILVGQDGVVNGTVPEGAVRMDVFADPICPFCGLFEEVNAPDLEAMREEGLIALYYHPIAFLDRASTTFYSTRAVAAMYTVAEYDGANFEAFYNAMFLGQPEEGGKGLSNTEIEEIARAAGVSEAAIAKIREGVFTRYVAEATNAASVAGVRGTPTVWIEGQDVGTGWGDAGWLRQNVEFLLEFQELNENLAEEEAAG